MNADKRRLASLELDTIHDPFNFHPWFTKIYQKAKFQPSYSKIVQALGKMNSIDFFYRFYFNYDFILDQYVCNVIIATHYF